MPKAKRSSARSSSSNLQSWLRDNGYADKYTEWVSYCVDNNDTTKTLADWLQENYPDIWRLYK